jgi:hypothetical protein
MVHFKFVPQAGREMKGKHYALVLSNDTFNKSELALVAPITQGTYHREGGFTVTLMGLVLIQPVLWLLMPVKSLIFVLEKQYLKRDVLNTL